MSYDTWWEAPPRPALLLATGVLLGPQSLDVLHSSVLELLAPVTPVALSSLAILAVLVRKRHVLTELAVLAVATAALLAWRHDPVDLVILADRGWRAVQACGAAALIGGAGLLLLKGVSPTARRVFVLGLLLLLGGISDFASAPALVTAAVAALIWARALPPGGESIRRDLEYLARPLAAALLVLTGAALDLANPALVLAAICIVATLALRRTRFGSSTPSGVYALAGAIDVCAGLHAGLTPLIGGVAIATIALQAATFVTAGDRTPVVAAGSTR